MDEIEINLSRREQVLKQLEDAIKALTEDPGVNNWTFSKIQFALLAAKGFINETR